VNIALVVICAYLLGCFTTGYYLVRLLTGRDIRDLSSGNAGSRNVGRLLGTRGFVLTFIGDSGKGMLAVWVVQLLGGEHLLQLVALTAVTAGHIWPLQLQFRGGKGFATYAGGMLLLDPLLLALGLLTCGGLYPLVRRTTMTGLASLALSPLVMAAVRARSNRPVLSADLYLYSLLVVTVLYAHRSNIRSFFSPDDSTEDRPC
jgi:glycerol-3-phosphate acyltransferase PlsY